LSSYPQPSTVSRCAVCNRPENELLPFDQPALFKGARLARTFRTWVPDGYAAQYLTPDVLKPDGMIDETKIIEKYGRIEAEERMARTDDSSEALTEDVVDDAGRLDEEKLVKKLGGWWLHNLYFAMQLEGSIEESWECRECVMMSEEEIEERARVQMFMKSGPLPHFKLLSQLNRKEATGGDVG